MAEYDQQRGGEGDDAGRQPKHTAEASDHLMSGSGSGSVSVRAMVSVSVRVRAMVSVSVRVRVRGAAEGECEAEREGEGEVRGSDPGTALGGRAVRV